MYQTYLGPMNKNSLRRPEIVSVPVCKYWKVRSEVDSGLDRSKIIKVG